MNYSSCVGLCGILICDLWPGLVGRSGTLSTALVCSRVGGKETLYLCLRPK